MCQELDNLAQDFSRYRGKRKRVRYPKHFWEKAVKMCGRHSIKKVAHVIGVSKNSLHRHLSPRNENHEVQPFIPIDIGLQSSVRIQVSGPLSMTVDFDRPTEELAKLMLAIQGGVSC